LARQVGDRCALFDFDTELLMAPSTIDRDALALGSQINFDSLAFVATTRGELRLDPASAPAQVLTFGSLEQLTRRNKQCRAPSVR
jgi:hypothetical protein